jgi:Na+-driven multidrug efflux pump
VGVAFLAFPDVMVGLFTRDPLVIADASLYLRAMALAQISMGLEIVLEAALGGAGYTLKPMLWNALFNVARIPLAAWLAGVMGLAGVWWAIGVTAVLRGVAMALLWNGNAWQRARV